MYKISIIKLLNVLQMIKFGEDVERELRTQIIQAKEIKPGVFSKYYHKKTNVFIYCALLLLNRLLLFYKQQENVRYFLPNIFFKMQFVKILLFLLLNLI